MSADSSPLRAANLALKFLLELAMLASLAYAGWHLAHGPARLVPAIGLPLLAIVVWGRWAAPRSARRLSASARVPLELGIFALAVISLLASGEIIIAAVFAVLIVGNAVLLTALGQWTA